VQHLRTFGCVVYIKDVCKLDHRSSAMMFVDYDERIKGYRTYDPANKHMHVTRNAIFDEEARARIGMPMALLHLAAISPSRRSSRQSCLHQLQLQVTRIPSFDASKGHAYDFSPTPPPSPSSPPLTLAPTSPPTAP
jgi:hypothetical protein